MSIVQEKRAPILRLCYGAALLALGLILPQVVHGIGLGIQLSPMHIPVLLAGIICGPYLGAIIGLILPLISCVFFGMPPIFMAVPMSFELAAYALIAGLIFKFLPVFIKKNVHAELLTRSYISLIIAMLCGRAVYGLVMIKAIGLNPAKVGQSYTWTTFWGGLFADAWLAIILQLILVPAIVYALYMAKFLPTYKRREKKS